MLFNRIGANKKSDLPVSQSDVFKPIRNSRQRKYIKLGLIASFFFIMIMLFRREAQNDTVFYRQTTSFFKDSMYDIINWQQDLEELKYPNSKGFDTNSSAEEDHGHYSVTSGGIDKIDAEKARKLEEELFKTTSYYDLNEFQGSDDGLKYGDIILLLIPLRNAEHVLPLMFKHLMNLDYPHNQIDIGFLVSDCSPGDRTLDKLFEYSIELQNSTLLSLLEKEEAIVKAENTHGTSDLYLKYMSQKYLRDIENQFKPPFHKEFFKPFRSVQIFEKNFGQVIGQGFSDRHAVKVQGIRRKLMGRARNWLINTTLKPYHSWVFWRDADIEKAPSSIIQDLMKFNYDVIVPNVWRPLPEFLGSEQPYDLNTWIESTPALELAQKLDEDDVIVEGYAEYPTYRVHLAYLKEDEGDKNSIIDMDGVGGVSILAKAKVFRQGVSFPAFTFENHAETEAFGKMARKMGFRVAGLPHYVVWHIYEPSEDDLRDIAKKERKKRRAQN